MRGAGRHENRLVQVLAVLRRALISHAGCSEAGGNVAAGAMQGGKVGAASGNVAAING